MLPVNMTGSRTVSSEEENDDMAEEMRIALGQFNELTDEKLSSPSNSASAACR